MKKMKVFSYLVLGLGVAQILLMLTSWLLTAAMPEDYNRSLLSSEGIRWFFGQFQDHLASPVLVWLVLVLWMNFLAIQNKCTAANAVNTGKHVGQGGFSGAVFSDQCMNFSLVNVKGNVLYGFCNTEVLAEIFYL